MANNGKKIFGDFQTPLPLAEEACGLLVSLGITPTTIVEPTCGIGNFVRAASKSFPSARKIFAAEINPRYLAEARADISDPRAQFECADFFTFPWKSLIDEVPAPLLVVGNLPWVTNAELGALGGANLPKKANLHGLNGLDALTGKANFDISEWMLLEMLKWCERRPTTLALMVKTAVARKVLAHAWAARRPVGNARIYRIDAGQWFGAAVDACLFVCSAAAPQEEPDCPVHGSFSGPEVATLGWRENRFVGDIAAFSRVRSLLGSSPLRWRSGVKHDCSDVMEFEKRGQRLLNGIGEEVDVEHQLVFPLFKSSQIARGETTTSRYVLLTQTVIGQSTHGIAHYAPKTWDYLIRHAPRLDARASSIYRNKSQFSVFGVGDYTFAPWKVAISGFYKTPNFVVVGKQEDKPAVFDDTVSFLSFDRQQDAETTARALNSSRARDFFQAFAFTDAKRVFTVDLLAKLNLAELIRETAGAQAVPTVLQPQLALAL